MIQCWRRIKHMIINVSLNSYIVGRNHIYGIGSFFYHEANMTCSVCRKVPSVRPNAKNCKHSCVDGRSNFRIDYHKSHDVSSAHLMRIVGQSNK